MIASCPGRQGQKKSPLEGSGLNLFSWKRIEETGRIMLQRNNNRQFIFLMTVIDIRYGASRARNPRSLGALEKMFYHGICHETIHGFAAREAGRAQARTVGIGCAGIS
jgi:hypothetical protein